MSAPLLMLLMDYLKEDWRAIVKTMREIIFRSRTADCLSSVRVAEILLETRNTDSIEDLLMHFEHSGDVLHKSLMLARIRLAHGNATDVRETTVRTYKFDSSFTETYGTLAEADFA